MAALFRTLTISRSRSPADPHRAWRPIDEGTGDEGGWIEGVFSCNWKGNVLHGENDAVNGNYVLGWSTDPQTARSDRQTAPRDQVLLWHMNYRPDGGQMFYPIDNKPFISHRLYWAMISHPILRMSRRGPLIQSNGRCRVKPILAEKGV